METVKVRPIFAWYDLWVGAFWDASKRRLYVFPLPCVGAVIDFGAPMTAPYSPEVRNTNPADEARLMRWVEFDTNGGCWLWWGRRFRDGYPRDDKYVDGRMVWRGAHREMWKATRGPIPDGLFVLHACDVPTCVNPNHLFLGTHQNNMDDRTRKGRNTRRVGVAPRRLPPQVHAEIRPLLAVGVSKRAIARAFGITTSTVRQIAARALNGADNDQG